MRPDARHGSESGSTNELSELEGLLEKRRSSFEGSGVAAAWATPPGKSLARSPPLNRVQAAGSKYDAGGMLVRDVQALSRAANNPFCVALSVTRGRGSGEARPIANQIRTCRIGYGPAKGKGSR